MTDWTFNVNDLTWVDNAKWWQHIVAGSSEVLGDVGIGDNVTVKDPNGEVVCEGVVYKKKEDSNVVLWLRSKNYDYLVSKGLKVESGVVKYDISKSATNVVDTATITIGVFEDFGLGIGKDVEVWVGNRKMLEGIVKSKDNETTAKVSIRINSYGDVLLRTYTNEIVYDMDIADIVSYLVSRYTDLSIDTIETGVKMSKLIAKDYLAQIIQRLADVVGYQFRTVGKTLYFKPIAYDSATTVLTRSSCRFRDWKVYTDRLVNQVYIVGGTLTFDQIDTFTGDGTTTTFQLTYKPKGNILVKVDGVVKVRDVDYTVDEDSGKITFTTAPAANSTIEVKYSYGVSIFLSARDDESIQKYGLFDKKERMVWIKDFDTAKNVARAILRMFSKPEISVKAIIPVGKFTATDIDVGKVVRCIDEVQNIDENLIVKSISVRDGIVEIGLGTHIVSLYEWSAKMQERVRMLELEHLGEDKLTRYYAFIEKIKVNVKEVTFRVKIQRIVDGFRLGVTGVVGVKFLGDKRGGWSIYTEEVIT